MDLDCLNREQHDLGGSGPFPVPRVSPRWIRYGGVGLAGVSFVAYLLLAQESGYGDGPGAILEIDAGAKFGHSLHLLYMPMVVGMNKLLGWVDISLFQAGCITSALGTAMGIALLYAATRRIAANTTEPFLVGAFIASCPAVVFFATTMEYHGPFFAFSSLATYAMVRLVGGQRLRQAAVVGLATALAYLAHASGHLLPGTLVLCFLALAPRTAADRSWRRQLLLGSVVLLTHVASVTLATYAVRTLVDSPLSSGSALDFIVRWARGHDYNLWLWPETFWYEMIWPYLLMSVTWVWGFRNPSRRPLVWAMLLAGLVHFGMCMALIPGYNEHGAYQTPLAWLLALIAVRTLRRQLVVGMIVLGAVLAVVQVRMHDDPEPARVYARGAREVAGGRPLTLVIGRDFIDYQACALILREFEVFDIAKIAGKNDVAVRAFLPLLDGHMDARLKEGRQVIFSAGAYEMLAMPLVQSVGGAAILKAHLDTHYRLQRISVPGFAGWRVQRR